VTYEVGAMDATFPIVDARYNGVGDFVEWNEVTVLMSAHPHTEK
jgi:hypothetical protein